MIMKLEFFEKVYSVMKLLSLVSHLCHSIMILSNHNEIPRISFFFFFGKIFTSLS